MINGVNGQASGHKDAMKIREDDGIKYKMQTRQLQIFLCMTLCNVQN